MRIIGSSLPLAVILLCIGVAIPVRPGIASASENGANEMADMIANAHTLHPAEIYQIAARLVQVEGREDEAVKWFYIGQLRYRFHLRATQPPPHSNESVLFAALSETVGQPVNQYAFGDVDGLSTQIEEALTWDTAHDNRLTSKSRYPEALAAVRSELESFRHEMLARKVEIRRLRVENGLSNRDEP